MTRNQTRYELAIRKGNQFNRNARWKEAVAAFRVALGEFKDRPEAFAGLGEACLGLKQLDRALDCFKLAARFSQGDPDHLLKVADIQERLGQLADAGRTYQAAGELMLRQREIDKAVGHWERAVRLEPNLLGAHQRLAMVFQRQGDQRGAVREYLAIARILDVRGDKKKALQICRAALRLDPHSSDIQTAMKLIKKGEAAYPELEDDQPVLPMQPEPAAEEGEDAIFGAVRQMASVLEAERASWDLSRDSGRHSTDPVKRIRFLAEEDLAAEIFREEEDGDYSGEGMIKLERDALIGQAMDFESRGNPAQAIICYEKVLSGGLELPAVYFSLGQLYLEKNEPRKAFPLLKKAAQDKRYTPGVRALLERMA